MEHGGVFPANLTWIHAVYASFGYIQTSPGGHYQSRHADHRDLWQQIHVTVVV